MISQFERLKQKINVVRSRVHNNIVKTVTNGLVPCAGCMQNVTSGEVQEIHSKL